MHPGELHTMAQALGPLSPTRVNQQIEALSLFLCHSAFQIKKKKIRNAGVRPSPGCACHMGGLLCSWLPCWLACSAFRRGCSRVVVHPPDAARSRPGPGPPTSPWRGSAWVSLELGSLLGSTASRSCSKRSMQLLPCGLIGEASCASRLAGALALFIA